MGKPLKIAIVSCYDQIDYVRTRVLRTAFAAAPNVEVLIVKNKHRGLVRYLEVPVKILATKLTKRPDVFVITFRGYEMLPLLLVIKGRTPLVFDEFINAAEYLKEHNKLDLQGRMGRFFVRWYANLLRRCRFILADTQAHADYSATLCKLPKERYRAIPVGTDETVFHPNPGKQSATKPFTVFYYGNGMTPLHGLQYVLDAAVQLKDNPTIVFNLVGGKEKAEAACAAAVKKGAHVVYERWIPFEQIAERAATASLCLGGPFGSTLQSQFVITGKAYQFLASASPVLIGKNKVSGIFKDKENCLLVPPADTQAIVEAITWAAQHPKELRSIGLAGRALYERSLSQAVVNKLVADMVGELQHGRRTH